MSERYEAESNKNKTKHERYLEKLERRKEQQYLQNQNNESVSNDTDPSRILTDLKFISEIKPGNKLCYTGDSDINIDTSYLQSLSRWANGYNRKNTLDLLEQVYHDTFTLIECLVANQRNNIHAIKGYKNTDLLHELMKNMELSVDGLNSLKTTYQDDKHTISRLDILMKKICFQKQYATENIRFHVDKA